MPHTGSLSWTSMKAACTPSDGVGGVADHRPVAAVLTCSDARLSPARRFGLPEGSLFVVRVAGNLATREAVASLAYAVDELGVETVVVLGHSHCGAVEAAVAPTNDPALACIVDPIRTTLALDPTCVDLACAVERNVEDVLGALVADSGPLGDALRGGRASLHGAVIDLATSALTDIPLPPTTDQPARSTTA